MTTITLEAIKQEHTRLAELIASFEAQAKAPCVIIFPEAEIELKDGEHYAGIITGKDGNLSHHLILLPEEAGSVNWSAAKEWAKSAGGDLPTRQEQALLYANIKEQFKPNWYWSSEQHASYSDCAWCQHFSYGNQISGLTSAELRARAVLRLIIQ